MRSGRSTAVVALPHCKQCRARAPTSLASASTLMPLQVDLASCDSNKARIPSECMGQVGWASPARAVLGTGARSPLVVEEYSSKCPVAEPTLPGCHVNSTQRHILSHKFDCGDSLQVDELLNAWRPRDD